MVRKGESVCKESDGLTRFKNKLTWSPNEADPALELFLKTLEQTILAIEKVIIIVTL